jgi:hypothetical protein
MPTPFEVAGVGGGADAAAASTSGGLPVGGAAASTTVLGQRALRRGGWLRRHVGLLRALRDEQLVAEGGVGCGQLVEQPCHVLAHALPLMPGMMRRSKVSVVVSGSVRGCAPPSAGIQAAADAV